MQTLIVIAIIWYLWNNRSTTETPIPSERTIHNNRYEVITSDKLTMEEMSSRNNMM